MIIGIGGPSQAGKSTLAKGLLERLEGSVSILSQDDFVKAEHDIPMVRDRIDWESPLSINLDKLLQHLEELSSANSTVIVEGIFAYSFPELNAIYDKAILIEIDKPTFWNRRKKETRWGKEPDWFLEHVWSAYMENKQAVPEPKLVVTNDHPIQKVLAFLAE